MSSCQKASSFQFVSCLFLSCCLMGCDPVQANLSVLDELGHLSRQSNWRIAHWRVQGVGNGYLTLFPFASDPRLEVNFDERYSRGWFVPGGSAILTWDGRTLWRLRPGERKALVESEASEILFATMAFNHQVYAAVRRSRIPCDQERQPCGGRLSFRIGTPTDKSEITLAESEEDGEPVSISLSPDAIYATLSFADEVRVYDTRDLTFRKVGIGLNATWSPNGRFIAFRHRAGGASLYDVVSGSFSKILSGRKVLGRLDWSPDSKFLLFSEPFDSLPCSSTRIVIYRVQDGTTAVVLSPCFGVTNEDFGWLLADGWLPHAGQR